MAVPLTRAPLRPQTKTPYYPQQPAPKKPPAPKQPYNWAGAAKVNWFPQGTAGLGQAIAGAIGGSARGDWGTYRPGQIGGNQYAGMIGGDYGVQEMESMMNARMGRAQGDFQSQLRQALIDLGVTDQGKLGSLGKYIDANTIQKAAENKYSRTAQVAQQETARRAQSEADLAARGLLSSGQLTTNAENILAEGEQQRYSALRDFLGAGQQGLTNLADLNDQQAMQLAQARAEAAMRAAEMQYYMGMGDYGDQGYSPYAVGGQWGAPAPPPVTQNWLTLPAAQQQAIRKNAPRGFTPY